MTDKELTGKNGIAVQTLMPGVKKVDASRRALFLKGGVALGATVTAAAAGANTFSDDTGNLQEQLAQLHQRLSALTDRDAIRQLHSEFSALLEKQAYDVLVHLFTDDASVELYGETHAGKSEGIRKLFIDQYGKGHASVRQMALHQDHTVQDEIDVMNDGRQATATFHTRVHVSRLLSGESVVAQMARLQGSSANTGWESGKFVVDYSRIGTEWRMSRLQYRQT